MVLPNPTSSARMHPPSGNRFSEDHGVYLMWIRVDTTLSLRGSVSLLFIRATNEPVARQGRGAGWDEESSLNIQVTAMGRWCSRPHVKQTQSGGGSPPNNKHVVQTDHLLPYAAQTAEERTGLPHICSTHHLLVSQFVSQFRRNWARLIVSTDL
jgi:hypothetical protein